MIYKQKDSVDTTQVKKSQKIATFLKSITPRKQFAFFDFDGTITLPSIDIEDYAIRNYLIDPKNREQWIQFFHWEGEGDIRYLNYHRKITRSYFIKKVTKELTQKTGYPENHHINAGLLEQIGKDIDTYILKNNLFYSEAIKLINYCTKKNITVVILTASPIDITKGLVHAFQKAKKFPKTISILGTEYEYTQQGIHDETVWLRGPNKTYVVQECKKRKGIAVLGAGDNPDYSDAFIYECQNQCVVSTKKGWNKILFCI